MCVYYTVSNTKKEQQINVAPFFETCLKSNYKP